MVQAGWGRVLGRIQTESQVVLKHVLWKSHFSTEVTGPRNRDPETTRGLLSLWDGCASAEWEGIRGSLCQLVVPQYRSCAHMRRPCYMITSFHPVSWQIDGSSLCTWAFSSCGEQRLLFIAVHGFSLWWLLLLRSMDSRHMGLIAPWHMESSQTGG